MKFDVDAFGSMQNVWLLLEKERYVFLRTSKPDARALFGVVVEIDDVMQRRCSAVAVDKLITCESHDLK